MDLLRGNSGPTNHPNPRRWLAAGLLLTGLGALAASAPADEVSLEALVVEALKANPELSFYEAEIAAAKGERRVAGKWANPEAEVTAGYKRADARGGGLLGDGAAWSVSVAQPFDFAGRVALRKAIANRQLAIAELGLEQFRADLAGQVRQRAFRVWVAQENVHASREVRDRVQELLGVLVQRDPAGVAPLLETRVIEANAVTLQRRATLAEGALQSTRLELNQLCGRSLDSPVQIARPELDFPALPPRDALVSAMRLHNYDLRIRQAELEQQGFKVQLSRKSRWPTVTLAPFYSHERAADDEQVAGIGVSLPLPLWDRKQDNVEVAQARLQQAQTVMQVSQRQAERQVSERALAYETQLAEMTRWRPDSIREFREAAALGDRHYRLGSLPVSTYLELQKQYLEATDALLNTQADALENWVQLELLIGRPLKALLSPPATEEAR